MSILFFKGDTSKDSFLLKSLLFAFFGNSKPIEFFSQPRSPWFSFQRNFLERASTEIKSHKSSSERYPTNTDRYLQVLLLCHLKVRTEKRTCATVRHFFKLCRCCRKKITRQVFFVFVAAAATTTLADTRSSTENYFIVNDEKPVRLLREGCGNNTPISPA